MTVKTTPQTSHPSTAEATFAELLSAAQALVETHPALKAFNGTLPDAPFVPRASHAIPMLGTLEQSFETADLDPLNASYAKAVQAAAPFAEWRRSYSEAEVGADFLARYGWFELLGPTGHYVSETVRAFVGIWGRDLYYPWHRHEAEEIYYVAAGTAIFEAEGDAPLHVQQNDAKQHSSNQLHAMTTQDAAILTLVLWRGAGLAGKARIPA